MSDLINRQAALDAISRIGLCKCNTNEIEAVDECLRAVKNLPPVTPTQDWIPVTKRLPESAGVYIVTREFTDGFECADLVDACYFDGTSTWHNDNRINHDREYVGKTIKAWMPLPEKYKVESGEVMEENKKMSEIMSQIMAGYLSNCCDGCPFLGIKEYEIDEYCDSVPLNCMWMWLWKYFEHQEKEESKDEE